MTEPTTRKNPNNHKVSETFVSVQGEGLRTGVLSVWVRYFLCNLSCDGFFQADPTDPSTYKLPYKTIDISKITRLEDLPVFECGCDSSYSWSAKYKHLVPTYTTEELANKLYALLPQGKFKHPVTKNTFDLAITGGEPMMNQDKIEQLYLHMHAQDNFPYDIQIETNGTQAPKIEFIRLMNFIKSAPAGENTNVWWSISPKLWNVAGEKPTKAWKPEVIKSYWDINPNGWLKFVMTNNDAAWDELRANVAELKALGVDFPVMIMPVGALAEQQQNVAHVKEIAERAIAEGYHISGRLHAVLFGNGVGT